MMWKLIDTNGNELKVGAKVMTFRNEPVTLVGMRPPHTVNSSGHVTVRFRDGRSMNEHEFYAGVVGAKWVIK
jgi:hypothetical protein